MSPSQGGSGSGSVPWLDLLRGTVSLARQLHLVTDNMTLVQITLLSVV